VPNKLGSPSHRNHLISWRFPPAGLCLHFILCSMLTRNPIVIWEEPRRHLSWQRITTPQSPHCLQRDAPHLPQNCPFLFDDSPTPSNTPSTTPTPLIAPNGIQIQSAVLPQFIRPVKMEWWDAGVVGYLSASRCRFAYGPADATTTHCLLLQ